MAGPLNDENTTQYKATQLWRNIVQGFRSGMPVSRHRLRMKVIEGCFTGAEAIEWLSVYLQSSGQFKSVSREQVITLLQKFLESDVIEDAKGKEVYKFDEGTHLYRFVTRPSLLNFLEDSTKGEKSDLCISNPYAVLGMVTTNEDIDIECVSSSERLPSADPIPTAKYNVSQTKTASIWKESVLARLLTFIELPSLDSVLSYDAVDGKLIADNVCQVQQKLVGSERVVYLVEAVEDVPSWVVMAMRYLSKWPDGCPADVTGGLPVYHGFEQDVLQSLTSYFSQLTQPLISTHLYDLHLAIIPLIDRHCDKAQDALQLCSLLISKTNRIQLHRLLRFINKTARNSRLRLCMRQSNEDVLLERFANTILKPAGQVITSDNHLKITRLIRYMANHYHHIFHIPCELRDEVEQQLTLVQEKGELERPVVRGYCQRVTKEEYECQKQTTSHEHLGQLLETIIRDENMSTKVKKQRLKQFKQAYPDIYAQWFPPRPTSIDGATTIESKGRS